MNPERRTQIVAAGIVIIPLVSTMMIWHATGDPSHSYKIALSAFFAFALLRRVNWARWIAGILAIFALASWLLILFNWDMAKHVVLSWAGIWILAMTLFYVWTIYTLLADRTVIEYFKIRANPESTITKQNEQASSSNGG